VTAANKIQTKEFLKDYFPLLFAIACCIFITFFFSNIPFFWDGAFFSETAVHFYNSGYQSLIVPIDVDTGGFPFFGIYMSFWWNLFGKTLLVSHIAILPFLIGLCWEFYKFSKAFLNRTFIFFAFIFFILEPTILTQTIIMSYDIILLYFSLLAINSLLKEKRILYAISLVLIAACSSRGLFMIVSLFLVNVIFRVLFNKKNEIFRDLICFMPMILFLLSWGLYHFVFTGWFLISPLRESGHESFSEPIMMFRQFIYAIWKILDFGRIFLFAFVILYASLYYKKMKSDKKFRLIILLFLTTILSTALLIMLFSNPVSHRYFLIIYILLIVSALYFTQLIKSRLLKVVLPVFFLIGLISGNFWMYPQKYGNGWDSSLKVLPFFKMDNNMKSFINDNGIKPSDVFTSFPLHKNFKFTYLLDYDFCYSDIDTTNIDSCKYYLGSNICNGYNNEVELTLKNNWVKLKEIRSKQLFLILYKNSRN
jgi:hypothetical protein